MEYALRDLAQIVIKDSAVDALARGASLGVQGISKLETGIVPGDMVAVFTHMGEVVSIGRAKMTSEEMMKATEGQVMETAAVVMTPGIYPSGWKKAEHK
jgi:H/ACA ribonucleoprotein complex subunit 4